MPSTVARIYQSGSQQESDGTIKQSIKESLIKGLFTKVLERCKKWKKQVVECIRENNRINPTSFYYSRPKS